MLGMPENANFGMVDPTTDGCTQYQIDCSPPGNTICFPTGLKAITPTSTSVSIGTDFPSSSTATVTCQKDNTWSSGTATQITTVYCDFTQC
ncbi:DUF281 domain-containing protein [Caenorhabditis elegans]|uniref:DUF281 domain-containing protein n=1 Tax=Caenorhabditis elegans TaxID=6239 RepID=A0A5S9MQQ5_CAEEL|nr:DUF281 domain-containing protein [Caenorhabditis elegans]CAA0059162.1 DUF281 domain-containing protein [Caenorhabditis elegans]